MSYQPQVPLMTQPPPPADVAPPPKGKRRKGQMMIGIILLVGGLGGGVATVAKGMSNYKDAVRSLARAPVGCTTTLVFDKPATFTVYAETKGKLGTLGGDCKANGSSYSHPGDKKHRSAHDGRIERRRRARCSVECEKSAARALSVAARAGRARGCPNSPRYRCRSGCRRG